MVLKNKQEETITSREEKGFFGDNVHKEEKKKSWVIGWQSKNSIFNLFLFFFCDWIHFFLLRLNLASILKKESKIWKKEKQKN